MTTPWHSRPLDEAEVATFGGLLALQLRRGDLVALTGPLGAGKTTLARAIVRAVLDEADAEVPSPTFALVQAYRSPRLALAHADLYRLAEATEVAELGLDEALGDGAALVEWPERAGDLLAGERLDIAIRETGDPATRVLELAGTAAWQPRIARLAAAMDLLAAAGLGRARVRYLQGDASPRRYGRLVTADGRSAILMDAPRQPDGPPIRDGKPYSRLAHLAEDVRPFVAVAGALAAAGLSAPAILAEDLDGGLLIVEDLGDRVLGAELAAGASQAELWAAASDVLLALRRVPVPPRLPLADGSVHVVPAFDRGALAIETELLLDWLWPMVNGGPAPPEARAAFAAAWGGIFDRLLALPGGWVLRDYHSPNLMWLPEREGVRRVGILDMQDAMVGPLAYDLVSLLQDARVDVPAGLETQLLNRYVAAARAAEPAFDEAAFCFAYAALGAQRNTKILGIFARLARRDGKPAYLAHLPRIWGYLARDLEAPGLEALKAWYDHHLPPPLRAAGESSHGSPTAP